MIEIVPARATHIGPIASRMRASDIAECALVGTTPKGALRAGLLGATMAWTAKIDGRPEAMFGVEPLSLVEGRGRVWMLGTDAIERHPVALLRLGRIYTQALHRHYPRLENFVPAHNEASIRWLSRLGFAVGAVDVYNGSPVRGFMRIA